MTDSPTRASRLVFLALSEFAPVHTRMVSPSRSTHTGSTCGDPSRISVARWATLAPRTSALISSEAGLTWSPWCLSGIGPPVLLLLAPHAQLVSKRIQYMFHGVRQPPQCTKRVPGSQAFALQALVMLCNT